MATKKKKQASKAPTIEGESIPIVAGETVRLYCFDCSIEFEVLHEPKYRSGQDIPGGTITHCPYCGGESLETQ